MIGDDVEIKIISVRGNDVQIGIEAPKRVPVHRREVYQRICAERDNGVGCSSIYVRRKEEATAGV